MDTKRLNYLISKYLQKDLTAIEAKELEAVLASTDDITLNTLIEEAWILSGEEEQPAFSEDTSKRILQGLKGTIDSAPVSARKFVNKKKWYWIAAAVVLTLSLFWYESPEVQKETPEISSLQPVSAVKPGTDGALLILDDGTELVLDSLTPGAITGRTSVILTAGKLEYKDVASESETAFHTVKTPRGRQFKIQLPDGSQVWLNAASSIRYPLHFSGSERVVQVTGEVYFDIVSNKQMPFVVEKDDLSVLVTGTEFNINTYNDESSERITLVEGAVRVRHKGASQDLQSGQQAILINDKIAIDANVDIEKVTAWKNGFFSFNSTYLESLMRMLSRWYDVEIVYEGEVPKMKFGGEISRNTELQQVLDILKESKINFRIEVPSSPGAKPNIIVSP